eukprot:7328838-Pyramimonas_sp.AAC.2
MDHQSSNRNGSGRLSSDGRLIRYTSTLIMYTCHSLSPAITITITIKARIATVLGGSHRTVDQVQVDPNNVHVSLAG